MPDYINAPEAAEQAGISRSAMYRLLENPNPPFRVTIIGSRKLIDRTSFEAWLAAQIRGPAGFPIGADDRETAKQAALDRVLVLARLKYSLDEMLLIAASVTDDADLQAAYREYRAFLDEG